MLLFARLSIIRLANRLLLRSPLFPFCPIVSKNFIRGEGRNGTSLPLERCTVCRIWMPLDPNFLPHETDGVYSLREISVDDAPEMILPLGVWVADE